MKNKDISLILVGVVFILLSHLINHIAGIWLYEPFLFPVAFVFAAIYGWQSRNFLYSFLVGFFFIPLMISLSPPYFIPFTFITNVLGFTNYNLLDTLIFCAFGTGSGLIGIGFVKLHKNRNSAQPVSSKQVNGES